MRELEKEWVTDSIVIKPESNRDDNNYVKNILKTLLCPHLLVLLESFCCAKKIISIYEFKLLPLFFEFNY